MRVIKPPWICTAQYPLMRCRKKLRENSKLFRTLSKMWSYVGKLILPSYYAPVYLLGKSFSNTDGGAFLEMLFPWGKICLSKNSTSSLPFCATIRQPLLMWSCIQSKIDRASLIISAFEPALLSRFNLSSNCAVYESRERLRVFPVFFSFFMVLPSLILYRQTRLYF